MRNYFLIAILIIFFSPALTKAEASIMGESHLYEGIKATGLCIKKISQDRGSVVFFSTVIAPNAGESSREANKSHQKLRDAVQALKIDGLQFETSSYSVSEEKEWVNKKFVSKGYRTSIALRVETPEIGKLGDIIAAATKTGIKGAEQLTTFVSPQKYKEEYESCLEVATRNAKDKAAKLARGAGVRLGKVVSISEGAESQTVGGYMSMAQASQPMAKIMSDSVSDQPPPSIDVSPVDINVSATVTFMAE